MFVGDVTEETSARSDEEAGAPTEAGAPPLLAVLTSPGVQTTESVQRTLWLCRVPRPSGRHARSPDSRAYDCSQVTTLTIHFVLKPSLSTDDDEESHLVELSVTVNWLVHLRIFLHSLRSRP